MTQEKLRPQAWFGGTGKDAFMRRSWMKNQGTNRRLHLDVPDAERERRRVGWSPPEPSGSGYQNLHVQNVLPADEGADFGFPGARRGAGIPRNSH